MDNVEALYRPTEIVIASNNFNKTRELKSVGKRFGLSLLTPEECRTRYRLPEPPAVEENGESYQENALLKAAAFSLWSGCVSLGDDSGLEIRALNNEPGLHSARYAETDALRIERVLRGLQGKVGSERKAAYVCSLCLYYSNTLVLCSDYHQEVEILERPQGAGGFGYDPIVYVEEFKKSFAELDFSFVSEHGFRAQAAKKLFQELFSKVS